MSSWAIRRGACSTARAYRSSLARSDEHPPKGSARCLPSPLAPDLFPERGYQQTTVAEIADAAEASKGTLFANFPSKEEIVFADTAPLRERLCHELRHRSSGLSAVDTLRAFVADHMIAPGPRALSAI